MNKEKQARITEAVKDILWMARRYANHSQTYSVQMFNDAYDVLRTELGDDIEHPSEEKHDMPEFPYAHDGGGDIFNRDNKNRPFYYKKP